MKIVLSFCVLFFVLQGCSNKISEGVYREDVTEWMKLGGEYPVAYYEFRKSNRFRYWVVFCFLNENGYGKYKFRDGKVELKFKRQKFPTYQIKEIPSERDSNFIEIEIVKMSNRGDLRRQDINLGVYVNEFDVSFYQMKYKEPLRILNTKNIHRLELLEYDIYIPFEKINTDRNIRIEINLKSNNLNSYAISDSIEVKELSIINDSILLINGTKFFKSKEEWR
jgi:hypothetical protein